MSFSKIKCQYCNLERSYSEKFVTSFLDQCGVDFYREKKFVWSQNKRYDFFVPCYQLIIETNGKQHYNKAFAFPDSRTLLEEKQNDILKLQLANQSGEIKHYISLNCEYSELDWIKNQSLRAIFLIYLVISLKILIGINVIIMPLATLQKKFVKHIIK